MTDTATRPSTPAEVLPDRRTIPAWARWSLYAAAGVFVLTLAGEIGDTNRLTAGSASQAMLRWAVPIMLAGLGGVYAERSGVINIGLEGMMVLGTWFGAWGAFEFGPWWGLVIGVAGGALGGLLHAIATVTYGVDHIISGVAIIILAPGITRYLSDQVFTDLEGGSITQSPRVEGVGRFTFPFLAGGDIGSWESPDWLGWFERKDWFFISDLAAMGRGLVTQLSWFTLIAFALVPISTWILWRTRFGLRLRSAGEHPIAADSLGVNVYLRKYYGVLISGALAGMAGAYIVIELTGIYKEGQTNGRGFIGLAALIFGNWRPIGVAIGSLLFGYVDGLQLRDLEGNATRALLIVAGVALAALLIRSLLNRQVVDSVLAITLGIGALVWFGLSDSLPKPFADTSPFAVVLLVLIFASQRLRMPAADGYRYRKGES